MNAFVQRHNNSIQFAYRCFDRLLLNGLIQPFQQPERVLGFFDIGPGDRVADLFTGGGYWTRILVPVVGPEGKVYAGNNPFFAQYFHEPFDALLAEPAFAGVLRIDPGQFLDLGLRDDWA